MVDGDFKSVITLWMCIKDFEKLESPESRKVLFEQIFNTFLNPASLSSRKVDLSGDVFAYTYGFLSKEEIPQHALKKVEDEVVSLFNKLFKSKTVDKLKDCTKRAKEWVFEGEMKSESVAQKYRARFQGIIPKLNSASLSACSAKELHDFVKVMLPMLVVYEDEHCLKHLPTICTLLEKKDPLSLDTLRRKGLLTSFLATHEKELPSAARQSLSQAVMIFRDSTLAQLNHHEDKHGDDDTTEKTSKTTFKNAIEAFAHGRSYNKKEKSNLDLSEMLGAFDSFKYLQYNPPLRRSVMDAEHFFEACKATGLESAKLYWYWGLHYFWIAKHLLSKNKLEGAQAFLMGCCSCCSVVVKNRASYAKPLVLWAEALHLMPVFDCSDHGKTLDEYLGALQSQCAVNAWEVDVSGLRRLLSKSGYSVEWIRKIGKTLRQLATYGGSRRLRQESVNMLLDVECVTASSKWLTKLFGLIECSAKEIVKDQQQEVFAVIIQMHRKKDDSLKQKLKRHEKGNAQSANDFRKHSVWVPNPSSTLMQEVVEDNPKKKYDMQSVVGKGASGTVTMARRKSDHVIVAIKKESADRQELLTEIQVMKMCKNKYIVDLIECLKYKDDCYLVMSYCDGGSLDALIKQLTLSESALSHIFVRVTIALSYLEKHFLVHRDVKPGNILLSKNGKIKLGDLGLLQAQVVTLFTRSQAGTHCFRAPEVLMRQGSTPKSDVYSLGCSVFNCVYDGPPFHSLDVITSTWKTITGKSPFPSLSRSAKSKEPSQNLISFITKCLETDPEKRVSAAQLLGYTKGSKPHPLFLLDNDKVAEEFCSMCELAFLQTFISEAF